jgi:hypothetical protein
LLDHVPIRPPDQALQRGGIDRVGGTALGKRNNLSPTARHSIDLLADAQ